jgi:hypothetical protein
VLVRKSVGPQVSVSGQYYVDMVSAASVDVVALASEYTEERTEYTLGVDYLHEDSILSLGYTNSSENDYEANTVYFSVSQEFFGGMSTVTLGYARGQDEVGVRGDESFSEDADRQNYQLGLSQVMTRNSLLGVDLEVVTDEGFLENPYRRNRYIDPDDPTNFILDQPERYPETRTSSARQRETLRARRSQGGQASRQQSLWNSLPRPLHLFATLLFIDFIGSFAFAFVEPQMGITSSVSS